MIGKCYLSAVALFCLLICGCCSRPYDPHKSGVSERSYKVCPQDLQHDALETLQLNDRPDLELSDLVRESRNRGLIVMESQYGTLAGKQCEDLLSMDPRTPVIRIKVPTTGGSEIHRAFVVVSQDGRVTHIEARYSFEPTSPSLIDNILRTLGFA